MKFITALLQRRAAPLATAVLATAVAAIVAGCGGGDGGSSGGTGSMRFALTDAPACGYDHVYVTIERVRVHRNADAGEGDTGWHDLTLNPARRVDLLTLQNGVAENLGTLPLPAGSYSQVRLVLAANDNAAPIENSLVPTGGGNEIALKTPSGQQSGVKLNVQASVAAGGLADVVFDFDACKSIVKAGNSGQYLLKPVITASLNPVSDIEGVVDPAADGALVSAQQGGVTVKSTVVADDGSFVLWPIAPGTYDLVITAPTRSAAVLAGITVGSGRTIVSTSATPLVPATGATYRSVAGSATLAAPATSIEVLMRALQTLTGGPTVQIAAQRLADETTPAVAYSFSLPASAPGKATWASGVTSYSFTPDAAATVVGKYTIEAGIDGMPLQTRAADISTTDATGIDFAF